MQAQAKSKLGYLYNYRPPAEDHPLLKAAAFYKPKASAAGLPASSDMRPLCRPIKNQLAYGRCTGEGGSAFKEIGCGLWGGGVPLGGDLSENYIYAKTRLREGTFPADSGSTVADTMQTLASLGVCPETWWPSTTGIDQAPNSGCDVAALPYRCGTPMQVYSADPANVQAVLAEPKPVLIGFMVYESFESVGSDGIVPMADPSREGLLGGHCVCVVGYLYIGAKLYFIIRNSWDVTWGDKGYAYMPAEYVQFWVECWTTPA